MQLKKFSSVLRKIILENKIKVAIILWTRYKTKMFYCKHKERFYFVEEKE